MHRASRRRPTWSRPSRPRLEPLGRQADAEDLVLYAVKASGGVVDQGATNGTEEYMRLSRTDLAGVDHVRLRVHGDTALETEYRLAATTFYRPWWDGAPVEPTRTTRGTPRAPPDRAARGDHRAA
jgi:hypothetical protein